jgi:hypothetical protein
MAMVAHEQPLFDKLLCRLVTSTIFVHSYGLIARKLGELFGFNRGVPPFYAARRCFDELSRGSVSCLFYISFEKQFHNAITDFLGQKSVTMASARGIRGE